MKSKHPNDASDRPLEQPKREPERVRQKPEFRAAARADGSVLRSWAEMRSIKGHYMRLSFSDYTVGGCLSSCLRDKNCVRTREHKLCRDGRLLRKPDHGVHMYLFSLA